MSQETELFYTEGYLLLPRPKDTYMRIDFMPMVMDDVMCHIFMKGITTQLKDTGRDCKIKIDTHPEIKENHYTWFLEDTKEIMAVLKTRK